MGGASDVRLRPAKSAWSWDCGTLVVAAAENLTGVLAFFDGVGAGVAFADEEPAVFLLGVDGALLDAAAFFSLRMESSEQSEPDSSGDKVIFFVPPLALHLIRPFAHFLIPDAFSPAASLVPSRFCKTRSSGLGVSKAKVRGRLSPGWAITLDGLTDTRRDPNEEGAAGDMLRDGAATK